ncbi:MAG: hypothetical protein ACKOB3_02190 [Holophagaceae bacterium]
MAPIVGSRRLLLVPSCIMSNAVVVAAAAAAAVVVAAVAPREVVLSVAMVAPAGTVAASTITPAARVGSPLLISFDLVAVEASLSQQQDRHQEHHRGYEELGQDYFVSLQQRTKLRWQTRRQVPSELLDRPW